MLMDTDSNASVDEDVSKGICPSLSLLSSPFVVELVALGQEEEADPPQPFRWRVGEEED